MAGTTGGRRSRGDKSLPAQGWCWGRRRVRGVHRRRDVMAKARGSLSALAGRMRKRLTRGAGRGREEGRCRGVGRRLLLLTQATTQE
jgi:hypothetical protein